MSQLVPTLPQWWTAPIAAAWARSRDAAVRDWAVRGDRSCSENVPILEHALAFGHGARSAYPHLDSWQTVSPYLRADWMRMGNVGIASWDQVAHIIEHEWRRAAGPGGDASPASPTS